MIIETKYEIGQKLWEIRQECDYTAEKCEHCGRRIYKNRHWKFVDIEQEIHGIGYSSDNGVTYKVWQPCVYRDYLPESEIGVTYFTTREAAVAECERRNAELRGTENE